MKNFFITSIFSLFLFSGICQDSTCTQLLIHEKGTELIRKSNMQGQSSSGFYLFRNCIYNISLSNGAKQFWQIVDIQPNQLVVKRPFTSSKDTVVEIKDLDKLYLLSAKNANWFADIDLKNYEFIFENGTDYCELPVLSKSIYKKDDTKFELIPYLTIGGIRYLYEENNETFVYQADLKQRKKKKIDKSYSSRYGIWFTPNKVERIVGLAIGIHANNYKNVGNSLIDSLKIQGINLELNFHDVFSLANSGGFGYISDDISYYNNKLARRKELTIEGVNLSLIGTNEPAAIKGLNLALVSTVSYEQVGLCLSGLNNFSYKSNGVSIAAGVNRSTEGKGIQIALFNRSETFQGIQIGFWNVIGDKSRPIINWNFDKKKTK